MNKLIIFLSLVLVNITIFSANNKIAIDARDYLANEIDITRNLASKTKIILDADTADSDGGGEWTVQVTENASLATAVEAANNYQAEKLVIIRMNQLDGTISGTETYARDTNSLETDLATKVQDNVVSLIGLNNRGVKNTVGDDTATMEVILFYSGFMDNTNDYTLMTSDSGSKNIAKGILFGLQEHFGLTAYDPDEIHDIIAPVITISSPNEGDVFNDSVITVSGTVTDDVEVSIVKVNNEVVTLTGSNFSKELTLTEGNNQIEVYAEDLSGNNVTKTVNVIYTHIDTTKPSINIAYPSYNSTVATSSIEIKGSVTDSDSGVKYFKIDGNTITLDANGAFAHSVTLNQGLNTFQLEASDNNDNIEQRDFKVNYEEAATDSIPPVISVISPSDNETVNTENINIMGSVFDDSLIAVFMINGREVALNNNNEFNFELVLAEGSNEVKLYARDEYGNQVNKTINITFNPSASDTTPPVITITSHQNNEKLNDEDIIIKGKVTDTNAVNSFKVNSNIISLSNTGEFSYNTKLQIGENKFEFEAIDDSGNKSNMTLTLYLQTHQNSGPEIIVISPKDGEVIKNDNIDIKGTVKDSDGVKYLSINNYKVNVKDDNTFLFNLPLSLGNNKLTISAKDNIDNSSEIVLNVTYKQVITKTDDGGCDFQNNNNKNFTNLYLFFIIILVLYVRRKWKKIKN